MSRVLLAFILCVCSAYGEKINVLAAASLKFVLEDIREEFLKTRREDGIDISYISSGKAYAQIKNGSNAQLFVSADSSYPQKIFDDNLALSEPKTYARGKLVLFSANKNYDASSLKILEDQTIKHIAIPNPKLAPYGVAAQSYIKSMGLEKKLNSKLVFGESIGQASAYVKQGVAEIGFSALSIVIKDKTTTYSVIEQKYYEPIVQSLVITKAGGDSQLAKDFAEYILGERARRIFYEYGYDAP